MGGIILTMPDYPQQPYGAPSPVPPKKEGFGKYIALAGVGCFFFLIVIVGIIFLVLRLTSGPVQVVNDHLTALRSGKIEKAYSFCSIAFQQNTNLDAFRSFVDSYPFLKNAKDFSSSNREISGGVTTLAGSINGMDGSKQPAEYHLVQEKGGWKIQYIHLSPSGMAIEKPPEAEQNRVQLTPQPPPQNTFTGSGAGLQITNITVEKQSGDSTITVHIRFRILNFGQGKSSGTAHIHLVQDLQTLDPSGNLLQDLSRDGIKELEESGQYQEYTHADFVNTLTIPTSYPHGSYTAKITVHDQIGNSTTESTAQFEIP